MQLGIPKWQAWAVSNCRKAYWHMSRNGHVQRAISKERLTQAGYMSILGQYESLHLRLNRRIPNGTYGGVNQPVDTAEMAQNRGISEALLIEILQGAFRNTALLPQYRENDEGSEEDLRQIASDPSSDPAVIYQLTERDQAIYAAFQSLSYRERLIVSSHLGFCPHCFACHTKDGTPIAKQSFRTIGIFHELKEKSVARIYNTALNKIREKLAPILF